MKFFIQFILIILLAYLAQFVLPWWGLFFAATLGGIIIRQHGFKSFLSGFVAIATLWFLQSYLIDRANDSILSVKMASLFSLPSPLILILITGFVGGICGGFGALTGSLFRRLFEKPKREYGGYV